MNLSVKWANLNILILSAAAQMPLTVTQQAPSNPQGQATAHTSK